MRGFFASLRLLAKTNVQTCTSRSIPRNKHIGTELFAAACEISQWSTGQQCQHFNHNYNASAKITEHLQK